MEPIKNKPGEEKKISGPPAMENDTKVNTESSKETVKEINSNDIERSEETRTKRGKVIAIICFIIVGILILYLIFRPYLQKRTLQSDLRKLKTKPVEGDYFLENKEEGPHE